MTSKTNNPLAIITGASGGLGQAFAEALARKNYNLILVARRKNLLNQIAHHLTQKFSINTNVFQADLSQQYDLSRLEDYIQSLEKIDLLINNASSGHIYNFITSEVDKQLEINQVKFHASVRLSHKTIGKMINAGSGYIINVASLSALIPLPNTAIYSATNAALHKFTEALNIELDGTGIKLQSLCPGNLDTPMIKEEMQKNNLDYTLYHNSFLYNISSMTAYEVVQISLNQLKSGKCLVIPGLSNQVAEKLFNLSPKSLAYGITKYITDKLNQTKNSS